MRYLGPHTFKFLACRALMPTCTPKTAPFDLNSRSWPKSTRHRPFSFCSSTVPVKPFRLASKASREQMKPSHRELQVYHTHGNTQFHVLAIWNSRLCGSWSHSRPLHPSKGSRIRHIYELWLQQSQVKC